MSVLDKVAYKPLDMSLASGADLDDDEDDNDLDDLEQPFTSLSQSAYKQSYNATLKSLISLRQLRIALYLTSSLLTLVFIIRLTCNEFDQHESIPLSLSLKSNQQTYDSTIYNSTHLKKSTTDSDIAHFHDNSYEKIRSTYSPSSNISHLSSDGDNEELRPQYTSYLSYVLQEHNLKQPHIKTISYQPIDDLQYPNDFENLKDESFRYQDEHKKLKWWSVSARDSGKYITFINYIRAMKSFSFNASITLTTQATTEFMYHTLELCKRWDGPISVAVFTPGVEFQIAITLIKFMRQCLPGPLSGCIKDKVTWHLIYNKELGPDPSTVTYPRYYLDSINYPLFVEQNQCPKFIGPEPHDLIKQFLQDLNKSNKLIATNFRKHHNLPYPINVLRNTARMAAKTKYLLASDIELYPSINLVPSFVNYLSKHNVQYEYQVEKFVFVLPIFEVDASFSPPKTKQELTTLMQQGHAVFFHKYVCDACQKFPNRLEWLLTDQHGVKNYRASDNELVIFDITLRNNSREWEPIFIGTNEEPYYDDRLTWEGRRDKMGQMYAMCLQDYHLLILGNAFLVHAPGIKRIDKNDVLKRLNYLKENNAIYDITMSSLKKQYAGSKNINKC